MWCQILCLLGLLSLARAGDVLTLTDSNFADELADRDMVLVKFYAPWCGHCKKLAPEFEQAAATLKGDDPPVTLADMDCTEGGKEICQKHGVSGYPTLKVFKRGELAFDYNGPRDNTGIVKYMRSKAGPVSKEIKTKEEAEKFLANDAQGIFGFFEKEGSDIQKQFVKLAEALSEDFRFAHTFDADLLEKYGYKNDVVIFQPKKMANKFEGGEMKYEGDAVLHKMKDWVNNNIHGLCGHRTTNNAAQFKKPLVVAYYDVDYAKNAKGTNYWRNRVMKVAKKFSEAGKSVYFAISSAEDFNHELTEYGLTSAGDKPVVAARGTADQKYIMSGEFSMDTLEKFVNDLLDDKLKAYLKTEPIPASNDEPVKVVVAEQFNEIVNNPDKDVLIEFYAPWCGHCKTLAPKYDELATLLKDEDEITIAKMDATANDVPSPYEVRGFPTIFFSPRGSKDSPKKFEGGREVDEFLKYLARESTNPLKGWNRKGKKQKTEL